MRYFNRGTTGCSGLAWEYCNASYFARLTIETKSPLFTFHFPQNSNLVEVYII